MSPSVDVIFKRLVQGQLSPRGPGQVDDGWEATLPGGQAVTRSTLQAEARPLVEMGAAAVRDLLPWANHPNAAIRYVAVFALGEITGERPTLRHFDDADADGARAGAIAQWQRWLEARSGASK